MGATGNFLLGCIAVVLLIIGGIAAMFSSD